MKNNDPAISTAWMIPGEICWVENQNGNNEQLFQKAKVVKVEGNKVKVLIETQTGNNEETTVQVQFVSERSKEEKPSGWEDMVSMAVLNEAEILTNVQLRFSQDNIFSYIGPTLIVMNPYKMIKESFNPQILSKFQEALSKRGFIQNEHPPHIYALSANAYSQLFANLKNQAIVISGESGAGKTENAKFSMQFITSLSSMRENQANSKNKSGKDSIPMEEKILRCNPILESFGNAKTVRNNNSSRFGKYVKILIDQRTRKIQGASIANYLLEKSRVTIVADGERNYHIFYCFLAGLKQDNQLKVINTSTNPLDYRYLSQTSCTISEGIDDLEFFSEVRTALPKLGFTPSEEMTLFKLLAAVLISGNIEFDDKSLSDTVPCSIKNKETIAKVAELLEVSMEGLESTLLFKRRVIAGSTIDTPITKQECCVTRDSMARAIYDRLFGWLVVKLNDTIVPDQKSEKGCISLGLLDIFGFENFKLNSLEQLCINFANEKLQQLYIAYVFKSEAEEFKAEGLEDQLKAVQFKDNQGIIDLLAKPALSLYDLLDESCALAQGSDESLLAKIVRQHGAPTPQQQGDYLLITKPTTVREFFTLRHTAKDVEYSINGFRMKNKDEISDSLQSLISNSSNSTVQQLWTYQDDQAQNAKNKTKANKYLGAKFRNQMQQLMGELTICDVHFVRCIKPNEQKKCDLFDQTFVMQQIRYLGILESVRVRKQGFPARFTYSLFFKRYGELADHAKRVSIINFEKAGIQQKKQICRDTIFSQQIQQGKNSIQQNEVLMGTTKVYLKLGAANNLDEKILALMRIKRQMADKIVKNARVHLFKVNLKKHIRILREKINRFRILQNHFRKKQQKKKELKRKRLINGLNVLRQVFEIRLFASFYKIVDQCANQGVSQMFKSISEFVTKHNQLNVRYAFKLIKDNYIKIIQQLKSETQLNKLNDKKQEILRNANLNEVKEGENEEDEDDDEEEEDEDEEDEEEEEKSIKDEFTTQGLDIWPPITESENIRLKQFALENQNDLLTQFLANNSNNIEHLQGDELRKYQTENQVAENLPLDADYNISFQDFLPTFFQRVQQQDFFSFCDTFINKSVKNYGKKIPPIKLIMSYTKENLIDPLSKNEEIRNHAQLIFRSILKLAKNRRSRFNPATHIENVIFMCYGTPEKMQEVIFSSVRDESTKISENYNSRFVSSSQQPHHQQNSSFVSQARSVNNNSMMNMNSNSNPNNISSSSSNTILNPQLQNPDDDTNIKEILATKVTQIVGNCHQAIRDECYLQCCKQMHKQPSQESLKILIMFVKHLTFLFPPSDFLVIPLLNFLLYMTEQTNDDSCKREIRVTFVKLSKIWQSYNMIRLIDFSQYTFDFLMEYAIFRDIDKDVLMKNIIQKRIYPFDFFYENLSRVEPRDIIPGEWERDIVCKNKLFQIKIFLLNETSLNVISEVSYSVKQVRDQALKQLGLIHRSQYFGIISSKIQSEGNKYTEVFLKNNQKILDAINLQANEKRYTESMKKSVSFKLYLRIKICFRLYKHDISAVCMYFIQMAFDVYKNRHNLKSSEVYLLAALHLYSEYGIYTPAGESLYQKYALQYIPTNYLHSRQDAAVEIYQQIISTYKALKDLPSKLEAKWRYIELLRIKDTFMTYQLESHIYSVKSKDSSYQKSKEAELITLGIRPQQIVILNPNDKSTKEVIELEQISTWGLNYANKKKNSNSPPQQYFFIKVKENDTLYVFSIFYLHVANLLIHSYALKKSIGEEDNEYKDCFLDILSILFDKDEQQQGQQQSEQQQQQQQQQSQ